MNWKVILILPLNFIIHSTIVNAADAVIGAKTQTAEIFTLKGELITCKNEDVRSPHLNMGLEFIDKKSNQVGSDTEKESKVINFDFSCFTQVFFDSDNNPQVFKALERTSSDPDSNFNYNTVSHNNFDSTIGTTTMDISFSLPNGGAHYTLFVGVKGVTYTKELPDSSDSAQIAEVKQKILEHLNSSLKKFTEKWNPFNLVVIQ